MATSCLAIILLAALAALLLSLFFFVDDDDGGGDAVRQSIAVLDGVEWRIELRWQRHRETNAHGFAVPKDAKNVVNLERANLFRDAETLCNITRDHGDGGWREMCDERVAIEQYFGYTIDEWISQPSILLRGDNSVPDLRDLDAFVERRHGRVKFVERRTRLFARFGDARYALGDDLDTFMALLDVVDDQYVTTIEHRGNVVLSLVDLPLIQFDSIG
jgi:hypothetical protein